MTPNFADWEAGTCKVLHTVPADRLMVLYDTPRLQYHTRVLTDSSLLSSCVHYGTPRKEAGPGTSKLGMTISGGKWQGALSRPFRMRLHHLEGFVDHVRILVMEFCLCRSRFPTQHQHSSKKSLNRKKFTKTITYKRHV